MEDPFKPKIILKSLDEIIIPIFCVFLIMGIIKGTSFTTIYWSIFTILLILWLQFRLIILRPFDIMVKEESAYCWTRGGILPITKWRIHYKNEEITGWSLTHSLASSKVYKIIDELRKKE